MKAAANGFNGFAGKGGGVSGSIRIVEDDASSDFIVAEVSRGHGARRLELVLPGFACKRELKSKSPGGMVVSRHYSAAGGLVLFARDRTKAASLLKPNSVVVTAHALVAGRCEFGTAEFESPIDGIPCKTICTFIKSQKSNSKGSISLVKLTHVGKDVRWQFRKHLKAAGHPVLGSAVHTTPLKGEKLAMMFTGLSYALAESGEQRSFAIGIPKRLLDVMDREARFAQDRKRKRGDANSRSAVPRAYATGSATFCGLPFRVTPAVMIPRRGSEAVVDCALAHVRDDSAEFRVLDLGTGSGCLLLAALSRDKRCVGCGIDASEAALEIAGQNAETLKLASRCTLRKGTFKDLPPEISSGTYEIILCNPPYHASGTEKLDADVKLHEPDVALFAPSSAYFYEQVLESIEAHELRSLKGGILVFEVAKHNAAIVRKLFTAKTFSSSYASVSVGRDANGAVRTVSATWR